MALERLLDTTSDTPNPAALYEQIFFPTAPLDRPYLFINMVSTVDGKIVIGEIGGTAKGVGGPTDQLLFRRLQKRAQAALLGSTTLRASNVIYPPEIFRFVVTRSGDIPFDNRFFTDAPEKAFVIAPENLPDEARARLAARANLLQFGQDNVDLTRALRHLRTELAIEHLLCEGGAALNEQLIKAGLADELFLTFAPKLKGGARLPTIVTGEGFPPGRYATLTLLSLYHDGDELYLRYRIGAPNS